MAREGATPTRFGPRPLNRARAPSFWTICRRHCMMLMVLGVVDEMPQCEMAMICGCDLLRNIVVLSLRRCSGRKSSDWPPFAGPPAFSARREGVIKAVELCRRVFTTSRGHVTTAPTVPADPPAIKWMKVSAVFWAILALFAIPSSLLYIRGFIE